LADYSRPFPIDTNAHRQLLFNIGAGKTERLAPTYFVGCIMLAVTDYEWAQLVINVLVAIGTIGAVIVALFGNWIQARWFGPKVTIEAHDLKGSLWPDSEGRMQIFYFLKVKNSRHWAPARGVRVVLTDLEAGGPDGNFQRFDVPIPWQFCWSPSETSETAQIITDERVFDFGHLLGPIVEKTIESAAGKFIIVEHRAEPGFWPKWYSHPIALDHFRLKTGKGGMIRYHLRPVGENFHCEKSTVVQVSWDGVYTEDLRDLPKHLQIRIV